MFKPESLFFTLPALMLMSVFFFGFQATRAQAITCLELAQSNNGAAVVESAHCSAICGSTEEQIIGTTECSANPVDNKCCWKRKSEVKPAPVASQGSSIVLEDKFKGIGLIGILNRLITGFLSIVGALALLVFVYAGVIYMASGGSEERVKHAKATMKYGAIGLAIIMFSYVLTRVYFRVLTQDAPAAVTSTPKK